MSATVTAPGRRSDSPVRLAPILYFVSIIVCCFGIAMFLPMLIDLADGNSDYLNFLICGCGTLFFGGGIAMANRGHNMKMNVQETLLAIPAAWLTATLCSAIPFMLSDFHLSLTDAVFETMSAISATGATVIAGLDTAPRGLLLWRFLLVWFGGFGVVTIAVLLLPFLRIGGLQLFSIDLSAQGGGKFLPRITEVVAQIGYIYIGLTMACALCYAMAGMDGFDAIGHAMAAVATAGFSSKDANLGYYNSPAIEWISVVFMTLSALPFVLQLQSLHGKWNALWRDQQVRFFFVLIVAGTALITYWRIVYTDMPFWQALREAAFAFVSAISCTGFTSSDYSTWGGFPELLLVTAMLVGGCTGSTAGGIKIFRIHTMLQLLRAQLKRQVLPHATIRITFNGETIPDGVRTGVANYFFAYLLSFFLLALTLAFFGMNTHEALGAAASALGGVGPSVGSQFGPCCTYASATDPAKWALAFGMLLGRLEILILLIPFSRSFWRN